MSAGDLIARSLAEHRLNRFYFVRWQRDNPREAPLVLAYLDGGARPDDPAVPTHYGRGLLLAEDARRALQPVPEPPPSDPPTGALTIRTFSDLESCWHPDFTRPAAPRTHPDGGGITVDANGVWRFVSTASTVNHAWGSRHLLARALITDAANHPHMVSRFRAMFPKAGNPNGFLPKWHACTFWEIGHTQISSGHNLKVDGSGPLPVMYSLVSRAPWGASVNDFDIHKVADVQFDHWYSFEEEVRYSTGADGRYKLTVDGRVVVDRAGPTMGAGDDPYGPQFGHYSVWDPAYPYRNEILISDISITVA